jgi:protein-disulfide isomerase
VTSRDHVLGRPDAPLTLVEYGDYECPFCGQAYDHVAEVIRRLGDSLRFVFRHFPLAQLHPNAVPAAELAECAGAQGKFWQMHERLFRRQDELEAPYLLELARRVDLDLDRVVSELEDDIHLERIREDFRGGLRSGASGAPTFFVNGERHDGSYDAASLTYALTWNVRREPAHR